MWRKILDISIMLTIFISSYVFFKEPFEGYITYIILIILFPYFIARFGLPKLPLLLFAPLFISGMIFVEVGLNTDAQFFKIFIGFFASVLFYNYVFQMYKFDIKGLFLLFMKGCYLVSLLGLIQVVSYQIGFSPGYDYSWLFNKWALVQGGIGIRMNSVFSEPAYYAAVVAPAFFTSTYCLIRREHYFLTRRQHFVIFIAYFLTFSTLGIIGMFVTLLLLLINLGFFKYALIIGPIAYFGFNYAFEEIPEFRDRLEGTQEVFLEQNITSYKVHGSSFVLYNNWHVATENFKRNWLFGTGLGSHPVAFEKYSLTNNIGVVKIDFNSQDANSLFLRLMSETGLYGMIVMLVFLIKCFVSKSKSQDNEMWLISNGAALIMILYLARQGHYFLNGFPFFMWLYYFTWKKNREMAAAKSEEAIEVENERKNLGSLARI
jgi:hypothetical protein